MKLIVGLGNPGKKYENNRHNLGFMVIDEFGKGLEWKKERDLLCFLAKTPEYMVIKPTTFMNLSGEAVKAVSSYYKIGHKDILVVHDELDLEFGIIRLSFGGSSAGHNGIESIIKSLASADFNRLRIGIGRSKVKKTENYVLSDFTKEEKPEINEVITRAIEAVNAFLADGIEASMNRFN